MRAQCKCVNRFKAELGLFLAALLGVSCSMSGHYFSLNGPSPPRPIDTKVELFWGEDKPVRPYEKVAMVNAQFTEFFITGSRSSIDRRLINELKSQARRAGGDAVMEVKGFGGLEILAFRGLSGTAIRYTDKQHSGK